MKTHRIGVFALILGAAAVTQLEAQVRPTQPRRAGAPAAAAQQQRQPGRQVGPRGGPAGMILSRGAQLNLTDDQVKKLQAQQGAPQDFQPQQTTMMRLQADLMDATRGDGNLEAARTALDKMSRVRNDAMIARLKARKDARDVLTVAQRAQLDQMESRTRQVVRQRVRPGMQQGMLGDRMRNRALRNPGMRNPGMRGPGVGPGMSGPGMGGPGMGGRGMGGPGMGGNGMGPGGMNPGMNGMRQGPNGPPQFNRGQPPQGDAPPPPPATKKPPVDSLTGTVPPDAH